MKSKKAEEYINKEKHEDYPGGYLCYQLSDEKAKKAVEIDEEEMREKATDQKNGWKKEQSLKSQIISLLLIAST